MTPATATFTESTPPAEPLTLPNDLWRAYRQERRTGSKQSVSVSAAFEAVGRFTKSDTRERLRGLLIERETRDGLALTSREIEDEIAAEAEGEGVPAEPEAGSVEAVRRDAVRTVAELEAKRAALAPEALTNLDARAQVETIDGEIREARLSVELADLAEGETARRAREQAEQAEREAREQASAEVARLEPVIAKARADVDAKAIAWATSVAALCDLTEQRMGYVAGAEPNDVMAIRSARFRPEAVVSGLKAAMRGRVDLGAELGASRRDALLAAEPEGE